MERKNIAGDDDYSFEELTRGREYDLHEFFADEFAGALLMPSFAINHLKSKGVTVEEMANYFNVSIDAVNKCLERLAKNPE